MTSSTLLFNLEKDIANFLIDNLESQKLAIERASQIAKYVIAHLPDDLSDEQVMKIVPSLDDEFVELAGIVHKYMDEYEKKYSPVVSSQVEDLIKHQHFDEANKLMKAYLEKKLS